MKIIKNNKGITLMSLVITIIVMLIIMTVTIASVFKDNDTNIIKNANKTNQKEMELKTKEEVLFAVMQSTNIYKEIDIQKLNSLLDLKNDIAELPANIETKDGYKFRIESDGTIKEIKSE